MKTQIPIYRAKKIDSDEYVCGLLTQDFHGSYSISGNIPYGCYSYKINLSTLEISFDGGKFWYDDFDLVDKLLKSHQIDSF